VLDIFENNLKKAGKDVTRKYVINVTEDDIKDNDLVMTLGGDSTFLRAAAGIKDQSIPIIGINTDPRFSQGMLNSVKIFREMDINT